MPLAFFPCPLSLALPCRPAPLLPSLPAFFGPTFPPPLPLRGSGVQAGRGDRRGGAVWRRARLRLQKRPVLPGPASASAYALARPSVAWRARSAAASMGDQTVEARVALRCAAWLPGWPSRRCTIFGASWSPLLIGPATSENERLGLAAWLLGCFWPRPARASPALPAWRTPEPPSRLAPRPFHANTQSPAGFFVCIE